MSPIFASQDKHVFSTARKNLQGPNISLMKGES